MNGWLDSTLIDRIINVALLSVAFLAWRTARRTRTKVQKIHVEVNSRLSELLESRAAEAGAVGEIKGRADERADRAADRAE